MLGVSLPLGANSIVILFLEPSQVLKSFQSEGAMRTFMVNGKGDVIAHPDSNVVLARASFLKSPIVESLLKSTNENGQLRFIDPDDGKAYIGAFQKLALSGLGMVSVIDEDTAFAAVYHIQNRNLWIMAIVLVISFLVVYFFSKTISVPIIDLVGATRQIEEGDYGISIEPMSGDEVGSLTHSFRQMAVGLGEREKLKDGMLRFVNKKVMEMTIAGTLKLGGESKDAAIFFSDLRGFTAMSETMTPEDVVAFLNEYFTGMVACVNQTHGEVDKFIGDAVMAHWGALESHGNDCENAINAAILMRKAIIAFNERGAGNRPIAKMGCGINFGPVVAGMLGSEEKLSYTVIGDAVNLASRIESLNKPLGTDILISQDAYERVPGIFKVEQMPSITVKGKSEPQVLYAVVGRLDDPDCPKDLDEVRRILGIEHDSHKEVDLDAKEEKFKVVGSAKGAH
jgi:adenylate cyclase